MTDPVTNPAHYTAGRQYEPRKVIRDRDLNCPNCGAPIGVWSDKCQYCGTPFLDLTELDFDCHKKTLLRFISGGYRRIAAVQPKLLRLDSEPYVPLYGFDALFTCFDPTWHLTMEFDLVEVDGISAVTYLDT